MRSITVTFFAFAAPALVAIACVSSSTSPAASGSDDSGSDDTGAVVDSGKKKTKPKDSGTVATDTGTETSDAGAGNACSFNRDCIASERCECTDGDCLCKPGARGSGAAGVDQCVDGNDCASSICVDGNSGTTYCSGECVTEKDCGPALPLCAEIALVGKICIRMNDAGK